MTPFFFCVFFFFFFFFFFEKEKEERKKERKKEGGRRLDYMVTRSIYLHPYQVRLLYSLTFFFVSFSRSDSTFSLQWSWRSMETDRWWWHWRRKKAPGQRKATVVLPSRRERVACQNRNC